MPTKLERRRKEIGRRPGDNCLEPKEEESTNNVNVRDIQRS